MRPLVSPPRHHGGAALAVCPRRFYPALPSLAQAPVCPFAVVRLFGTTPGLYAGGFELVLYTLERLVRSRHARGGTLPHGVEHGGVPLLGEREETLKLAVLLIVLDEPL